MRPALPHEGEAAAVGGVVLELHEPAAVPVRAWLGLGLGLRLGLGLGLRLGLGLGLRLGLGLGLGLELGLRRGLGLGLAQPAPSKPGMARVP